MTTPELFFLNLLRSVDDNKFSGREDIAEQLAQKFITSQRFIDYVTSGGPFVKFEKKKVDWSEYELNKEDLSRLRDLVLQIVEKTSTSSLI